MRFQEADLMNLVRKDDPGVDTPRVGVQKSNLGAKPHPIRKKAFVRAFKGGRLWLIAPYSFDPYLVKDKFERIIFDRHCPNSCYIVWPF